MDFLLTISILVVATTCSMQVATTNHKHAHIVNTATPKVRLLRPIVNFTEKETIRFWSKVQKSEVGCWNWTGRKARLKPYGLFDRTSGDSCIITSRISFMLEHGSVPEDKIVCHRCDNPSCVNPAHLFLGTFQDNMDDMKEKGRRTVLMGEDNGYSKLTNEIVLAIRARYAELGGRTKALIAREFGIPCPTVKDILSNKKWRHLLPA